MCNNLTAHDKDANRHIDKLKLTSIHMPTGSKKTRIQFEAMCFHISVHQILRRAFDENA